MVLATSMPSLGLCQPGVDAVQPWPRPKLEPHDNLPASDLCAQLRVGAPRDELDLVCHLVQHCQGRGRILRGGAGGFFLQRLIEGGEARAGIG